MSTEFESFSEIIKELDKGINYTYTDKSFYVYSHILMPFTDLKKIDDTVKLILKKYTIQTYSDFNYDVSYQVNIQFGVNVSCYLYISLIAPYATIYGDKELPVEYQKAIENLIKELDIELIPYNILTEIPMYPPVYLEQAEEGTNLFHCFFTS